MLNSQVLETAIGLVLMFFVLAFAASTVVELISRFMSKRAKDLERTLEAMLTGKGAGDEDFTKALEQFKGTSIYKSLDAAAGKSWLFGRSKPPSYISAKSFADAVTEMLAEGGTIESMPPGLQKRLEPLVREAQNDLLGIKAGLESWFDETMKRLEGSYKRWATIVLFAIGLVLTVGTNASTVDVAQRLWHDPVTRQAVSASAEKVLQEGAPASELTSVAETTSAMEELGLPVGWQDDQWKAWKDPAQWDWEQLYTAFGWLLTALLIMMGAPFWYDVLTRLSSLRSSGSKPPPAPEDGTSATAALMSEQRNVVLHAEGEPPGRAVAGEDQGSFHGNLRAALGVPATPSTGEGEQKQS